MGASGKTVPQEPLDELKGIAKLCYVELQDKSLTAARARRNWQFFGGRVGDVGRERVVDDPDSGWEDGGF